MDCKVAQFSAQDLYGFYGKRREVCRQFMSLRQCSTMGESLSRLIMVSRSCDIYFV